jgi:hypothetical protein
VFREYYERDRHICNRNGSDIGAYVASVKVVTAFERFDKREVGIPLYIVEFGEVYNFESVNPCRVTDYREYCRKNITRKDTDYERYHLYKLFAVYRAKHRYRKGYESAYKSDERRANHCTTGFVYDRTVFDYLIYHVFHDVAFHKIAYRVTGERKSDYGNGRSDDDCRHKFVYPVYAGKLNYYRYYYVYKPRKTRADDKSEITYGHRNAARKSRSHRTEERERRT